MLKLIHGEFFRVLHKKNIYIYFISLAVASFLLALSRSGRFNTYSIVKDAINLFYFMPPLAGGFLFSAIYTDDLNSKNLITLVGFGISKTKIVVAKLLLFVLFGSFIFALVPLYHCAVYAILGQVATADMMATIYAALFKFFLITIAFASLSGIAVYSLQRATFAIVLYILLTFNVISGLLKVAFNTVAPNLASCLISGITDKLLAGIKGGGAIALPIFEYVIYVAITVVLSVVVFHKKEMEF
ncbi:MAG: hypothetical protein LBB40_00840 [Holophagales bacterium]|jgi:hypothetical protein|nr:hypothetical protein [Holophagales bacterium]